MFIENMWIFTKNLDMLAEAIAILLKQMYLFLQYH